LRVFRIKKIFFILCKNALAFYNVGVGKWKARRKLQLKDAMPRVARFFLVQNTKNGGKNTK
jgi:hypothetical protein